MSQTLGSESNPLRIAIVGGGPSGFYAAESLFKSGLSVSVDMYDRLPTPYGLLRGGVAPDHQQMKSVAKAYERVALSNPQFQFLGNIKIGEDVTIDDLKACYDAIIFACGAETDKHLGIPGENLPGSYAATEFVGWYNSHPNYRDRVFDLQTAKSVAIIGQGNVAIDVTRILAKTTEELAGSDIAEYAKAALAASSIQEIHLIGRRGPVQSAFTELEIKELGELLDAEPVVDPGVIILGEACQAELDEPTNNKARKNFAVLQRFAGRQSEGKPKKIYIRFFESPVEIKGDTHVKSLVLENNRLAGPAGAQKAEPTGEKFELACDLVFRSVGYRGVAIPGVPFDEKRGVFPNVSGRLTNNGQPVYGFYAVGWIKRGPSGVLGSNKPDSADTVKTLISDLDQLKPAENRDNQLIIEKLGHHQIVSFSDWKKIEAEEIRRGETLSKPRDKFSKIEEMLEAGRS